MKKALGVPKNIWLYLWHRKKLLVVVIIVVLIGGGVMWRRFNKKNGLEMAEVSRGTVQEELILSGEVKATEHANMAFLSSGEISSVFVNEGDFVKKGAALAKLDTELVSRDLERAKSDLRSAEATLERVYDDVKDSDSDETFTEKEDRTIAEVAKDKAYDALKKAEKNIQNSTLLAPFDGIIVDIVNPFSGVSTLVTQTQIEIINPNSVYFEVVADQTEVIALTKNSSAEVILDSYPEYAFGGTITDISYSPSSDEVGTVYAVKVSLNVQELIDRGVKIGMSGDARFVLDEVTDVLYVPTGFIKSGDDGKYILGNGGNKEILVDVGIEGEERVEVKGEEISEGMVIYD